MSAQRHKNRIFSIILYFILYYNGTVHYNQRKQRQAPHASAEGIGFEQKKTPEQIKTKQAYEKGDIEANNQQFHK